MSLRIGTAWRESASSVGTVGALERGGERAGGLLGIGGADDVEVRDDAQAGDRLDRLVRGAVFADADAVVREDVDRRRWLSAARRIAGRQ